MRKIINGKRYDTDTAKEMGKDWYSNRRDFHFWIETLYRKNTGEFFLHGEGGPASRYAVTVGQNQWEGGEKIIPLSIESAKDWAEKHLSADEYEAAFGDPEGDEKKTCSFSLSAKAIEKLKRNSSEAGVSISEYIERLLDV